MNTPTFFEQYNKVTTAYFNDELNPWDECACFVGNLLNGESDWAEARDIDRCEPVRAIYPLSLGKACISRASKRLYTLTDIIALEGNFLTIIESGDEGDEQKLFEAMDSTLDMLRRLHESKGEIIEDFEFTKRQVPA